MNLSSIPPKKITPRHQQLALLKANGLTNNRIAELTGYTIARVSILLSDSRLAALVAEYQQQLATVHIEEAAQLLTQETMPTLRKVLSHRDSDDATASLKACDMLLARALPATKHTESERTTIIRLELHEIQRIQAAEDEMKIVEAQGHVE